MQTDQPNPSIRQSGWRPIIELVAVSVAAGITAATFVLAARHVADVGDLLGFAGAFVGAVMTIGGAIWVERHRLDGAEERDRLFLTDCIRRIEELASLTTLWAKEIESESFHKSNATAISLLIQIRSSFSEALVIENSIQKFALVKAKWSVRAIVNLNWLKDRTEEGLKTADDPKFSWKSLLDDPSVAKEYVQYIHSSSATMLVLAWRLLLVLKEKPKQIDHSSYPIDSEDVVYRHKAGMDF